MRWTSTTLFPSTALKNKLLLFDTSSQGCVFFFFFFFFNNQQETPGSTARLHCLLLLLIFTHEMNDACKHATALGINHWGSFFPCFENFQNLPIFFFIQASSQRLRFLLVLQKEIVGYLVTWETHYFTFSPACSPGDKILQGSVI